MTNIPIEIIEIVFALKKHNYKTLLVGGCVRDHVMGRVPKDFDLATTAKPDEVIDVFKNSTFKVIPTGIKHGTVTIVGNLSTYEITTLRIDQICDGRHAVVEFTSSFKEDSLRRDLTINALFIDPIDMKIYDFVGGEDDIKNKVLRFVGDPTTRIKEDGLRILRILRFYSQYDQYEIDPQSLSAVEENRHGLEKISVERIRDEIIKVILGDRASQCLMLMFRLSILQLVLPELINDKDENQVSQLFELLDGCKPNFNYLGVLLAVLFHQTKGFDKILLRLKFPKILVREVAYYIKNNDRCLKNNFSLVELRKSYIQNISYYQNLIKFVEVLGTDDLNYLEKMQMVADNTPRRYFKSPLTGHDIKKHFPDIPLTQIKVLKERAHELLLADEIGKNDRKADIIKKLRSFFKLL